MKTSRDIDGLLAIMAALRTPGTGCAWDLAQDFSSVAPYTIEEAYEVADAVARDDMDDLCEELGDVLLQVVFHARMAEERGAFAFPDVVEAITQKMIRRHPHVFDERRDWTPAEVKASWKRIKAEEKAERAARRVAAGLPGEGRGWLDAVSVGASPLKRAVMLQDRAGQVGFDWNDARAVLAKLREEIDEIEAALDARQQAAIDEEIGDLLFVVANLARHAKTDPDGALSAASAKFERRFAFIERALAAAGRTLQEASLDEMEALWGKAKAGGL
jgi:ATP diphosphatase